jgi:hypothetical protein
VIPTLGFFSPASWDQERKHFNHQSLGVFVIFFFSHEGLVGAGCLPDLISSSRVDISICRRGEWIPRFAPRLNARSMCVKMVDCC